MKRTPHPADIAQAMATRELNKLIAQAREIPATKKITVKQWRERS